MANINEALILKLERLAYLSLTSEERKLIQSDLNNILRMIDQLKSLDTEGVEPLRFVNDQFNIMRKDIPHNIMSKEEAFKSVSQSKDGFFILPKIIK